LTVRDDVPELVAWVESPEYVALIGTEVKEEEGV